ncbi:hypothetical protein E4H12_13895 [Candidatus Thorarchaeota archaeon]|nr:MAG: hypothetical protein E4H12_13895 [Candidatus Thorarchaeota archaeon]
MVKQCGKCGSTDKVQYVFDSFCESGEWRCNACLGARFPEGSRIVKFTDKSHPLRPAYYMCVETQEDLDLIMTVGERAQKLGAKGMEACFYATLIRGRPVSPQSFSLGHADSESRLRAYVDSLRMHLETSEKFNTPKEETHPEIIWSQRAPVSPAK